MNILDYNLRNIIGHIIVIVGLVVFLFFIIFETKKLGWAKQYYGLVKYGMILIITVFSSLLIMDTIWSTAPRKEYHSTIEVTNITFSSGFGGISLFESATIYGVDEGGNESAYSISLFCSKRFKEEVFDIVVGDVITLSLSNNQCYFYFFVKTEELS